MINYIRDFAYKINTTISNAYDIRAYTYRYQLRYDDIPYYKHTTIHYY